MQSGNLFSGTAQYYADYRPEYPARLLTELRRATVGEGGECLVDWGCGTGEIALPLCDVFREVVAIDIDAEMIAVARKKAARMGVTNVRWNVGRAEDLSLAPKSCDLIAVGSAFHWMDRSLLCGLAFQALKDEGALAIVGGGSSVWAKTAEWHEVAIEILKKHVGEDRRAGGGTFGVSGTHEDYLVPAGFRIEQRDFPVEHSWGVDEIIGFLHSTSFASVQVLQEKRDAFEFDLREALARVGPAGFFKETLQFHLILAYRNL